MPREDRPNGCSIAPSRRRVCPATLKNAAVSLHHEPYSWDCLSPEYRTDSLSLVIPRVSSTPTPPADGSNVPTGKVGEWSSLELDQMPSSGSPMGFAAADHCWQRMTPRLFRYVIRFGCHSEHLQSSEPLSVGSYVVVNGDDGIDVGVVTLFEHNRIQPIGRPGSRERFPSPRYYLAPANQDDMLERAKADAEAQHIMRQLQRAAEIRHLPHEILGVELQVDRHFCVVYYRNLNVLQRELFRDHIIHGLFAAFHCRFWFQNVTDIALPWDSFHPIATTHPSSPCDDPEEVDSQTGGCSTSHDRTTDSSASSTSASERLVASTSPRPRRTTAKGGKR